MIEIANYLTAIRHRITAAARQIGHAAESVTLVAVSKTHGEEKISAALAAGQRVFGENRVQEAAAKFTPLRAEFPDIELHLIGPLQTNKAEDAVRLFDVIEVLDRPKLAVALAAAIEKTGRRPRLFVEVNIGDEPQKAGVTPAGLGDFLRFCRTECGLAVEGLMCIPPQNEDPEKYFHALRALAAQHGLAYLSMGMSGDFECAIRCGATHVRIGTAIFGAR